MTSLTCLCLDVSYRFEVLCDLPGVDNTLSYEGDMEEEEEEEGDRKERKRLLDDEVDHITHSVKFLMVLVVIIRIALKVSQVQRSLQLKCWVTN